MDAAICVFSAVNLRLQCRINPAAYLPENVNRYFHFPRVLKIICMQAVLVASLLYSLARILLFSLLQTPFIDNLNIVLHISVCVSVHACVHVSFNSFANCN